MIINTVAPVDTVPQEWMYDLSLTDDSDFDYPMFLYHIHRAKDLGDYTQGYIGITCNPLQRYKSHRSTTQKNPFIRGNFKKYSDTTMTVIAKCSMGLVLEMEEHFRPEPRMSWNFERGGNKKPNNIGITSKLKGKVFTDDEVLQRCYNHFAKEHKVYKHGVCYEFEIISLFAKQHNLCKSSLSQLLRGDIQVYNDFTLLDKPYVNARTKLYNVPTFYDNDTVFTNMSSHEIITKFDIKGYELNALVSGKAKRIRTYTFDGVFRQVVHTYKSITLRSPQSDYITKNKTSGFTDYGLRASDVLALIKGIQKKAKKFTLVSYEIES